jgi:tripartite-type tricarboxylate transporter receptor subunit TctC
MKPMSRLLIGVLLCTVVLVCIAGGALAQSYPSKPINIITAFPPGGAGDSISRILGGKLTESWGQQVVVFNRGGGNTVIGTEIASKAPADGYNLFLGQPSNMTIVPALYKYGSSYKLSYDTMKDFTPVAFVGVVPLILGVSPGLPVKSVKELIALAKSKPGKLNYSSSGKGGTTHLGMEMLKIREGIDIVHIPYIGSGNIIAIMTGEVDFGFMSMTNSLPHVKAGKIRALAISGSRRSPVLSDLPTVSESGLPGFQVDPWVGILTPTGTPREIVVKLNTEINKILLDPKVSEKMASIGIDVFPQTPEQFGKFLVEENALWNKVIKDSGVKMDF